MSTNGKPLRLEYRTPAELADNPANWRSHPKAQTAGLVAAVSEVGWAGALLFNETTGRLIDGHARKKLPASVMVDGKVPVLVGRWTEDQERLILATLDPLAAMAEASKDKLGDLLKGLGEQSAGLQGLLDGLAEREGIDLGGEPVEDPEPQLDRAAELQEEWGTASGQLWEIGRHRLLCGDATKGEDVARVMGGEKGHLVVTDPPYGVGYDGGTTERTKLAGDNDTALYPPTCAMAFTFTDEKAALYLFHAGVKGYAAAAAAAAAGYEIRCELVWNKNQAQYGALSAQYKQKHEPFYYCHKSGKAPRWFGPTNEVTVWDCDRASVNEHHPTQKPPELIARAIRNSSEPKQVVCDWFLGSGTTMVAAEQLDRTCYGIEIEPKYVAVALQRMKDMGLEPRLI